MEGSRVGVGVGVGVQLLLRSECVNQGDATPFGNRRDVPSLQLGLLPKQSRRLWVVPGRQEGSLLAEPRRNRLRCSWLLGRKRKGWGWLAQKQRD